MPAEGGLLAGVRVIEVAILSPSALGGHLAELGADVIKVESGSGDYVRSIGRRAGQRTSDLHQLWNRGKRSVEIELDTEAGQARFRDLVAEAEVVVEGRRPGYLARLGLGYEDLLRVNPALVFTCLSGFGDTGPYRSFPSHGPAFDAYAGALPPATDARGRPRIPRPNQMPAGVLTAPLHAALATVSAVLHARATGRPTYLDIAQADAATYARAADVVRWRQDEQSSPNDAAGGEMAGDLFEDSVLVQYYRTADGRHVLFQAMEPKFLERFAALVGRPELSDAFPADREADWLRGREDLRAEIAEIFASRPAEYWIRAAIEHNIPVTPVNEGTDLLGDPHFVERARWLADENDGPAVPALPVRVTPPLPAIRRAPDRGEHSSEILGGDAAEHVAASATG
ncbi:CaiB/BaiF CoA transferase family protein [Nocardia aobensis]|uniref:CaiB/BaiF CoA transferase family protein n=1 Tax=Nocardia aobensis TaxID=257277 RepID=A0ABW6P9D5_9NOCA